MDIRWPGALLLLGLVPLIVAAYLWMLRRRRRFAVRFSSLSLVRVALPRPSRLRRHGPFALFVLALTSLIIALARPVSIVSVPTTQATILLAIDVSRSMCAMDILPSRLEAAKSAALSFIQEQPHGTQIGIVAFARFAELVQPPTTDQDALEAAIDTLITGRGTAIGSGIIAALNAIAEIDTNVAPVETTTSPGPSPTGRPAGSYAPEIIVVLTDGVNSEGLTPQEAAIYAAERGVRVYTIGFGTENSAGAGSSCGGFGGGFSGGGFSGGGGGFRRGIDEAALKEVAEVTGGRYYAAASSGELNEVFADLPTYFTTKEEETEISVVFAAIGVLLAALAVGLSLLWNPLP